MFSWKRNYSVFTFGDNYEKVNVIAVDKQKADEHEIW